MTAKRKIHGVLVEFRDLGDKIELVFNCNGQRVVERCPKADGLVSYLQAIVGDEIDFLVGEEGKNASN